MSTSGMFMPAGNILAAIEIIDFPGFIELFLRFSLNMAVVLILARWLYYSSTKRKDYLFSYILISSIVFMICFLLESVKLQVGFALGLFAIFGILRYRTDAIPIREMTYLFLVIGLSVINALTDTKSSLVDILFTNAVIIFITWGFEKVWLLKNESSKIIIYEKIDLIKPERREELLKDLQDRTGINKIKRIETGKIDFLKDTCTITIFYETIVPETSSFQNRIDNNDDDD